MSPMAKDSDKSKRKEDKKRKAAEAEAEAKKLDDADDSKRQRKPVTLAAACAAVIRTPLNAYSEETKRRAPRNWAGV